jgi:hypothetical protein
LASCGGFSANWSQLQLFVAAVNVVVRASGSPMVLFISGTIQGIAER